MSGVGLTGVTSLAVTWGRSSAVGDPVGVPLGGGGAGLDHVQQRGGDGAGQRVAAFDVQPDERGVGPGGGLGQGGGGPAGDGDLVEPVEQVIEGTGRGAARSTRVPRPGSGVAHKISGRLPVRLVMMNSEKQVRMRCRVTRHQGTWLSRSRTGLMAAGTPTIGGDDGQPVDEGGVVGELDPAEDQAAGEGGFGGPPPDGADDRPGGHDGAGDSAGDQPGGQAGEQGDDRVPFAGGHGGGQDGR